MNDMTTPPSDAAPPFAWALIDRGATPHEVHFAYQSTEPTPEEIEELIGSPDDIAVLPLYAHPEDAPGGPWETCCFCGPGIERVQWSVHTSESKGISRDRRDRVITCDYQGLSKVEAIAVRDALNRLPGGGG